jgi:hypothetical protein
VADQKGEPVWGVQSELQVSVVLREDEHGC